MLEDFYSIVKLEPSISSETPKAEIKNDLTKIADFGKVFKTQANKILTNSKLMPEKLASVTDIVRARIGIIETKTRLFLSNLEARIVKAEADHRELQG
jgi:hypothetical protein